MESKNYKTYISYSDSKTDITATTPDINSDGVSVVSNTDNNINVIQDDKFYKTDIGNINQKLYDRINGDTPDSSLHLNYNDKCFLVEISTAQNQGDNAISVKVKNLDNNEICKQKNYTSTIKLLNECEFTLHEFEESNNSQPRKIIKGSVNIILDAKPKNEIGGGGEVGGEVGGEDGDEDEDGGEGEDEDGGTPAPPKNVSGGSGDTAAQTPPTDAKAAAVTPPAPHTESEVLKEARNPSQKLLNSTLKEWENFVGKSGTEWMTKDIHKTNKLQKYFTNIGHNILLSNRKAMDEKLYKHYANGNTSSKKLSDQIRLGLGRGRKNKELKKKRRYQAGLNAAIHKVLTEHRNSSGILADENAYLAFKENVKNEIIRKGKGNVNHAEKFKEAHKYAPGYYPKSKPVENSETAAGGGVSNGGVSNGGVSNGGGI